MSRLHFFLAGLCLLSFGGQTAPALDLVPVWRKSSSSGEESLAVGREAGRSETDHGTNFVAFRAVVNRDWPEGLVPVFRVEAKGGWELRRLPMAGRENFTDPLFFALPLADEPEATRLAGRWNCSSKGSQGNQHRLAFEFAVESGRVAGRFDQDTDYRFAFVTGGTWRSNRVELTVEYINDHYSLSGVWHNQRLTGEWQQLTDGDHGTWEATRPGSAAGLPSAEAVVPLYEWRRTPDGIRRYTTCAEADEPGWERAERPLCRVWRP